MRGTSAVSSCHCQVPASAPKDLSYYDAWSRRPLSTFHPTVGSLPHGPGTARSQYFSQERQCCCQKREVTGHRALMQAKPRLSGPVSGRDPLLGPQEPHPAPFSSHQRSNHSTSPVTRGEKSKTTFNNRVLQEQEGTAATAGHSCAAGSACSNSRACVLSKAERGLRRSSHITALQIRPCIYPFLSSIFFFSG